MEPATSRSAVKRFIDWANPAACRGWKIIIANVSSFTIKLFDARADYQKYKYSTSPSLCLQKENYIEIQRVC